MESEPQKRLLYEIDNFSYALLFSTIDREDSGFIDFNNLNGFFESQGIYPYEEEVISILRRLDRDDDGRITLQEFKNGLTPKNFTGVSDLPILYCPKVLSSPKQKQRSNEKRLLSPSKNYPFEAIRRPNSPNQKANLNNSHYKERVFSPVKNGNSNLVSILKSGSKKRDEEKSIIDLKKEIKRDLSISKKINSPNRKRTPEKKNNFKSFHEQNEKRKNATDSKMNSRPLKTILKSPLPKKVTHFDSMKKNLEKEMEFSKKINHSFHKKSESFMSSLNAMSMKISPKKSPRLELKKDMNELASYFKKIIALEREVERIKQDLALRPDFNLMDFFSMFDKNEKGYINQTEIKNFLDSLGINPNDEHFSLFLKRFDRNNFGRFKLII